MAEHGRSRFNSSRVAEHMAAARVVLIGGVPWRVHEVPASPFDRRDSPSLVFESDDTMRRVRDFPGEWRQLSDEELSALSWSR